MLQGVEQWHGLHLADADEDVLRDREELPHSLRDYLKAAWHIMEPGRPYVGGWHIDAIADHMEAMQRGDITRLLVNIPPRMTKSTLMSVAYPSWCWLKNPATRLLTVSYAEKLALRDALKSRRLMMSDWYQERFGHLFRMTSDQNEKKRYENNRTGYRAAFSMGGGVMGEGGDCILVDDPQDLQGATSETERANTNETFDGAVSTRLNDLNKSTIAVVQQRLHEDDLTGHILRSGDDRWVHLMLPMEYDPARRCTTSLGWTDPRSEEGELLCEERMGRDSLSGYKKALRTAANISGQLQQDPKPLGGNLFRGEWFGRFDIAQDGRTVALWPRGQREPVASKITGRFATVDTALSAKKDADPTVMLVFGVLEGGLGLCVLEEHRKRQEAPDTTAAILRRWNIGDLQYIGIESASAGLSFIQSLQRQSVAVRSLRAETDKVQRSVQAQVMAEAGQFFLPRTAPWVNDYIAELEMFPMVKNDDRVDATSYGALEFLRGGNRKIEPVGYQV